MKHLILLISISLMACLRDPYAPPANYGIQLYCWHYSNGEWHNNGLPDQCPPNTPPLEKAVIQ